MSKVTVGHRIKGEVWFCIAMESFIMSKVTVGHRIKGEVRLRSSFQMSSDQC